MDTIATWMRRIGLWMIAAYAAFVLAFWVVVRFIPGPAPWGFVLPTALYADALLFLAALAGVVLLNTGTAWGILAYKRGRVPAPLTRRELGVAAVVGLMAIVGLANSSASRTSSKAIVVRHDNPAPARPYKELYPQRASAEPGDLERRLGEAGTLDHVTVKVTNAEVIERRGEFDFFDPGYYLIVYFDVANRGSRVEYSTNESEWSFDVPGKGLAKPVFPVAPMQTTAFHHGVPPGTTASATLALYLGPDRTSIRPGDYFAIWYAPRGCAVSDANYLPKDYCRAVWPIGHF